MNKTKSSQGLLRMQQASMTIAVHPNTLRRWCDQGLLKCYRIGKRGDRRFKIEDLEELLTVRTGNPSQHVNLKPNLTPRKLQIVEMIRDGSDHKTIAKSLHLSLSNVKYHVSTLATLLNVKGKAQLVVKCIQEGYIGLNE